MITQKVLSDSDALITYLSLSLDHNPAIAEMEMSHEKSDQSSDVSRSEVSAALYEKLLKASVDHPDDIKWINQVLSEVDLNKMMPAEFSQMYQTFLKAIRRK